MVECLKMTKNNENNRKKEAFLGLIPTLSREAVPVDVYDLAAAFGLRHNEILKYFSWDLRPLLLNVRLELWTALLWGGPSGQY